MDIQSFHFNQFPTTVNGLIKVEQFFVEQATGRTGLHFSQCSHESPEERAEAAMPQTSLAAWLKPKDPNSKTGKAPKSANDDTEIADKPKSPENWIEETANAGHVDDSGIAPLSTLGGPVITLPIPPNAQLVAVTDPLLADFKSLIALLLPVPYRDGFYADILEDPVTAATTLAALWRDNPSAPAKLVAGIRCRLFEKCEAPTNDQRIKDKPCLYIAAIGTLAPFRNYGLATALLAQVTITAAEQYGAGSVMAHVWEANEEARAWYAKLGFEKVSFEPTYYRRLKPAGAHIVLRRIQPSDLLRRVCPATEAT